MWPAREALSAFMVTSPNRQKIFVTIFLGTLWIFSLGLGLRSLFSYETRPGPAGNSPESWPVDSKITLSSEQYTLVMLAHPRCPCTRASIGELANVMAKSLGKIHAYVLLLKPTTSPGDWTDTELRRSAAAIPGVTVVLDQDGLEAKRFGAITSGHTLLFDLHGRRIFNGGITASRGHAGENAGENAILALVANDKPLTSTTLVFGCPLTSDKQCDNSMHR